MADGKLTGRPPLSGPGSVQEFISGARIQTRAEGEGDALPDEKVRALKVGSEGHYPWEQPAGQGNRINLEFAHI